MRLWIILYVALGLIIVAGPLSAHHSGAIYDKEHPITLSGTVTKFSLSNPHAKIYFDVKDEKGNVVNWVAEMEPPQRLRRYGWNLNTLKPGDPITLTGFPARDGSKEMNIRDLPNPKAMTSP